MATIDLHNYLEEIGQYLEQGQYVEAAQHCRYILKQFPRHVDTYRALGKAYLEQKAFDQATDIFYRVLSADPNDFIAHVGLSIIQKEEGLLDNAIWHMERAYEMEPYNIALKEELLTLYRMYDDQPPARLPLTRGALARLYARGQLYQQAATELRALVGEDPDRIDLEVLLAEVLWRDDQRVEAVNLCLGVLDRLPNCIQANAILAEIWLLTGRIDEAQTYLRRLRDLTHVDRAHQDVETPVGRAFKMEGALPLPEVVEIEHGGSAPLAEETVGIGADSAEDAATDSEPSEAATYDWLDEVDPTPDEPAAETVLEDELDVDADTMDELESEWQELESDLEERQTSASDWFFDQAEEAEFASEADAPEWVTEELETAEPEEVTPEEFENLFADDFAMEPPSEPSSEIETDDEVDLTPDWLRDVDDESFEPVYADPDLASDWLASIEDETRDELTTATDVEGGVEGEEWFADLDEEMVEEPADAAVPDRLMTGPLGTEETQVPEADEEPGFEEDEEDMPDWLMTGSLEAEERQASEADEEPGFEEDEEDMPDWLMTGSLEAEERQASEADEEMDFEEDEEGMPESFMTDPLEPDEPQEPELEIEDDFREDEEEMPDWLMTGPLDAGEVEEQASVVDEAADDSGFLSEETAESEEYSTSGLLGADESADLPSWLVESDSGVLEEDIAAEVEAAQQDESGPLEEVTEFSTSDLLEQYGDEELPDWLLQSDELLEDTTTADQRDEVKGDSAPLAEIGEVSASDLVGDEESEELPDWLQVSDSGMLADAAPETDTPDDDSSSLKGLDAVSSSELTGEEDEDLPEWVLQTESEPSVEGETADSAPAERVSSMLSDVDEYSTSGLLGEAVEGDLPDWLLHSDSGLLDDDIAAEVEAAQKDDSAPLSEIEGVSTTDLLEEYEDEELPDWLLNRDAESGEVVPDAADEQPEASEITAGSEEREAQGSGMLDWLQHSDQIGTEEMEDVVIGEGEEKEQDQQRVPQEPVDDTSAETDEEPDWLSDSSTGEAMPAEDDVSEERAAEAAQNEALPDWLMDMAPDDEDEALSAAVSEPQATAGGIDDLDDDASVEEMLDWLQPEEEEEAREQDVDTDVEVEAESDDSTWLSEAAADAADDGIDESPEWLNELMAPADEADTGTPEASDLEPAADPEAFDWSDETVAAEEEPSPEMQAESLPPAEMTEEEETAESDVSEPQAEEAEFDLELEADVAGDDLDWLGEIGDEEPAGDLFAGLMDDDVAELADTSTDTMDDVSEEDVAADVVPEDLDEAMAWLEKLAADQGAPLEELPSLQEADADEVAEALEDDESLDWLEVDEPELATEAMETAVEPEIEAATPEAELAEEEPVMAGVPEDLEEAMTWLEQLTADSAEVTEAPDDEPLDWLEEKPGEVAVAEPESARSEQDELAATLDRLEELALADASDLEVDVAAVEAEPPSATDELTAVLNWLEAQEFAREETAVAAPEPAEEGETADTTEVAATEPELAEAAGEATVDEGAESDTIASAEMAEVEESLEEDFLDEMPEDPDEAMAWLEKLAARQGAPLEELPSVSREEMAEAVVSEPEEAPEEEGEAELESAAPEPTEPEMAPTAEADEPEPEEAAAEEDVAATDADVSTVPEDLDDAMAWLEQLAAKQGAPLDELPSVQQADDIRPDSLTFAEVESEETAVDEPAPEPKAEAEPAPETLDTEISEPEPAAAAEPVTAEPIIEEPVAEEPAAEEPVEEQEPPSIPDAPEPAVAESEDESPLVALEEEDSWPTWLSGEEDEGRESLDETGFLRSLEEPDVSAWLAAEEEASSQVFDFDLPETDSFTTGTLSEERERESKPLEPALDLDFDLDIGGTDVLDLSGVELDEGKLASAREKLSAGYYDDATDMYQSLVETGSGLGLIIGDLEAARAEHSRPMLRRLLGDAYMRNGQLQRALDTYREALDML